MRTNLLDIIERGCKDTKIGRTISKNW